MPPERTATTYGPGVTAASRSVLLELMVLLRAYRESLVLVGGWVPHLLLAEHQRPDDTFQHVGSIDIDLAVDPATLPEVSYATIVELLNARGYRPALTRRGGELPGSLLRTVASPLTQKPYTIQVDFLIPQHNTHPGRPAHQAVQDDLLARKIKGCEAAFTHQTTVTLTGSLPDGGMVTVPMRMLDVVGSLTMKGIVLGERYREKDAYDIYALVRHYAGGPKEVAALMQPYVAEPLVQEGLRAIQQAFGHRTAHGPAWVASFLASPLFAQEHARLVTDAFMVVSEFLAAAGCGRPQTRGARRRARG